MKTDYTENLIETYSTYIRERIILVTSPKYSEVFKKDISQGSDCIMSVSSMKNYKFILGYKDPTNKFTKSIDSIKTITFNSEEETLIINMKKSQKITYNMHNKFAIIGDYYDNEDTFFIDIIDIPNHMYQLQDKYYYPIINSKIDYIFTANTPIFVGKLEIYWSPLCFYPSTFVYENANMTVLNNILENKIIDIKSNLDLEDIRDIGAYANGYAIIPNNQRKDDTDDAYYIGNIKWFDKYNVQLYIESIDSPAILNNTALLDNNVALFKDTTAIYDADKSEIVYNPLPKKYKASVKPYLELLEIVKSGSIDQIPNIINYIISKNNIIDNEEDIEYFKNIIKSSEEYLDKYKKTLDNGNIKYNDIAIVSAGDENINVFKFNIDNYESILKDVETIKQLLSLE